MPESYIPLRGRAQAVTVVFVLMAVLCGAAVYSDFLELGLMNDLVAGEEVTEAEATANDDRQQTIGIVQIILGIAAAVVFIRWMYAAYRNVDVVAAPERRYDHGWAIGSWFVPIMNLFRPKQIVNDIWRAGGRDYADAQPGFLLLSWWLLFLISRVVSIGARNSQDGDTLEALRSGTIAYIVSDAMLVVAAVLAIVIVRKGTDRLDAKAAAAPPPPAAPEPDFQVPERPAGAPA